MMPVHGLTDRPAVERVIWPPAGAAENAYVAKHSLYVIAHTQLIRHCCTFLHPGQCCVSSADLHLNLHIFDPRRQLTNLLLTQVEDAPNTRCWTCRTRCPAPDAPCSSCAACPSATSCSPALSCASRRCGGWRLCTRWTAAWGCRRDCTRCASTTSTTSKCALRGVGMCSTPGPTQGFWLMHVDSAAVTVCFFDRRQQVQWHVEVQTSFHAPKTNDTADYASQKRLRCGLP